MRTNDHTTTDASLRRLALSHPGLRRAPRIPQRELQVLRLVAEGHSNAVIARALRVSEETVKTYVRNLLVKLDAANRAQAVAEGFRLGLLD